MPRMIEKLVAFIQWLSAPEDLPSEVAGVDPLAARTGKPGFSRWLLHADSLQQVGLSPDRAHPPRFWHWILDTEELPIAKAQDHDQSWRTMFLTRLLEAEPCPRHTGVAVEHRESFFRRLLATEQCPAQPQTVPQVKRGFARWLLKQEECPIESPSAPVRRHGFWYNLFASEKL